MTVTILPYCPLTVACCLLVAILPVVCNVARFAEETIKLCASHTGLCVDATFLTCTQNTTVEYFMRGSEVLIKNCSASLPPPTRHTKPQQIKSCAIVLAAHASSYPTQLALPLLATLLPVSPYIVGELKGQTWEMNMWEFLPVSPSFFLNSVLALGR